MRSQGCTYCYRTTVKLWRLLEMLYLTMWFHNFVRRHNINGTLKMKACVSVAVLEEELNNIDLSFFILAQGGSGCRLPVSEFQ